MSTRYLLSQLNFQSSIFFSLPLRKRNNSNSIFREKKNSREIKIIFTKMKLKSTNVEHVTEVEMSEKGE